MKSEETGEAAEGYSEDMAEARVGIGNDKRLD
jgi:hypothetical protein